MFWQMVLIENGKLYKRTMYKVALGCIILLLILLYGGLYWLANTSGVDNGSLRIQGDFSPGELEALLMWPQGLVLGYQATMALGSLLLIVLVGTTTAQDYQWRYFQTWLSRGVPRWVVLLAKFGAAVLVALAFALTAVFVSLLATGTLSQLMTNELPFGAVSWGGVGLNLLLTAYAMLPYAALTLLVATLTRSTGATLAIVIILQQIGESLIQTVVALLGDPWQSVVPYLPSKLMASILFFQQGDPLENLSPDLLLPQTAVWVIAVYIAVLLIITQQRFQRQDLGG